MADTLVSRASRESCELLALPLSEMVLPLPAGP